MARRRAFAVGAAVCVVLALAVAGCCAPPTDPSDTSLERVRQRGTLVVGIPGGAPPFASSLTASSPVTGFDVGFAKLLGEQLGVQVRVRGGDVPAVSRGLRDGTIDVALSGIAGPEVAEYAGQATDPYYEITEHVVVMDEAGEPASLDALAGGIIGAVGRRHTHEVARAIEGISGSKLYDAQAKALKDLRNGKVDAVVIGQDHLAATAPLPRGMRVLAEPLPPAGVVAVVAPDAGALRYAVDAAIREVKGGQEYRDLVETWLEKNAPDQP